MPQFAVITRTFRVLDPIEIKSDLKLTTRLKKKETRDPFADRVYDVAKAYLVEAPSARAAMRRVERLAQERNIELIIHRAIEVAETLGPGPGLLGKSSPPIATKKAPGK
jgi:hypothetical protein